MAPHLRFLGCPPMSLFFQGKLNQANTISKMPISMMKPWKRTFHLLIERHLEHPRHNSKVTIQLHTFQPQIGSWLSYATSDKEPILPSVILPSLKMLSHACVETLHQRQDLDISQDPQGLVNLWLETKIFIKMLPIISIRKLCFD